MFRSVEQVLFARSNLSHSSSSCFILSFFFFCTLDKPGFGDAFLPVSFSLTLFHSPKNYYAARLLYACRSTEEKRSCLAASLQLGPDQDQILVFLAVRINSRTKSKSVFLLTGNKCSLNNLLVRHVLRLPYHHSYTHIVHAHGATGTE